MGSLLQWNLKGYFLHLEKFNILISDKKPKICCLQETNFKQDISHKIKDYVTYYKNRTDRDKASGGVATLISESLASKEISLTTNLEVVVTTILQSIRFTILNVYTYSYSSKSQL